MEAQSSTRLQRTLLALMPVLIAFIIQLLMWSVIRPLAWFLFFPAVFFSSWLGGRRFGVCATVISTLLVWYFFLPPERSLVGRNAASVMSSLIFLGMGIVFSLFHDRLRQANQQIAKALATVQTSNEQLEMRVRERTAELAQSNEALRESEEKFRLFIEHNPAAMAMFDREIRYLAVSPRWMQEYRLTGEIIGRSHYEILPDIPEHWKTIHRRCLAGAVEKADEDRFDRADGSVNWLRWEARPWLNSTGEIGGIIIYSEDITERKRAKERLIEQAALLNLAQDAIIVRDLNNQVIFWNKSGERIYGWTAEEAIGRDVKEMQFRDSGAEFEKANQAVKEKGTWYGEIQQTARDGRRLAVDCKLSLVRDEAGNPKSILAINTDITEKKRLESQFLRAQRLESIGTLASGIAHDLNNVLSPILMGAQMLQMKIEDEQSQRLLVLMQANAERGAEMIKQVLSFARGAGGERVTIQPKHLIREIVRIAEETFPKFIQITQRFSENLWVTSGDATQLHQALMNLCINARDAMPQGGELTIEVENQTLDEMYAGMLKGASPGNFVAITVADTGKGIPPEIIDRIFDPFFTTKEPGRGTGLGLATVQGIVGSHNGFIIVESKPELGTKFKIYLPAHEAASRKQVEEERAEILPGAGELILVIDDEATVREIARTTLESFGYRVMTADNGATALGVFAKHRDEISLVITDMMMPVMDGPLTIRALQKMNLQVPIIASSGLSESINKNDLGQLGVRTFLVKPYGAATLLETVARALSQSRTTSAS